MFVEQDHIITTIAPNKAPFIIFYEEALKFIINADKFPDIQQGGIFSTATFHMLSEAMEPTIYSGKLK
jgi:hypothetical protein